MARKGNHSKKGIDQSSSKSKKKDSELKVVADDLLGNGQHNAPLTTGINETSFTRDGRRKNKCRSTVRGDELVDGTGNVASVHADDFSGESVKETERVDSHVSHARYQTPERQNSAFGHTVNGSLETDRVDKENNFHHLALESLRTLSSFSSSILRTSHEWLERQRPFFISITKKVQRVRDFVQLKLVQSFPIVLKWLSHVGKIVLLVSMLWLNCVLRGMGSFLRMETTSFVSVLWFSILSAVAMIGMLKFLLLLAVAALFGVLLGFAILLLLLAVSGAVILWLYGSFWMTSSVIILAGLGFKLSHERIALSITTIYALYCAGGYVGWLGLLLAFHLSFITSDALIYFLQKSVDEQRNKSYEQTEGAGNFFSGEAQSSFSDIGSGESADRSSGVPSTSGADSEMTSEDEVVRLLNCRDHYSALGLSRYQQVDVSVLKREYRKKAMLVHPDKNMGNEKAAEAFKKLQNAYEVLLDSLKRKDYDEELRKEELLNYLYQLQSVSQKNGRNGFFSNGFARSESDFDGEDSFGEARRIACKKCGSFHVWFQTKKSKTKARWCQECKDFHQAKDGDGWVEQSSQPLFFGILQKVDLPVAYVCADSKVYDATEWYICQGMRCPANSHKPSFHVNTSVTKASHGKGPASSHRGGATTSNMEEKMTEEEFFEWLQNAMQSGMFENTSGENPFETHQTSNKSSSKSAPNTGGGPPGGSSSKKKKKGKKQW